MPWMMHIAESPEALRGCTHRVSATGVMIILREGIPEGTKFILENPKTQQKVEVNVVRPPQMNQEGSLMPVEFLAAPSSSSCDLYSSPFVFLVDSFLSYVVFRFRRPFMLGVMGLCLVLVLLYTTDPLPSSLA